MSELNEIIKQHCGNFDPETNRCKNFGNVEAESDSSVNHIYDFTHLSHLELTGEDRAKFINNFCTAKIIDRSPGESTEAFVLDIRGHILQHLFVFVMENSLRILSGPNAEDFLFQHLDRYLIMEDVEILRRTEEWGSLFLTGDKILSFLEGQDHMNHDWSQNSHIEIEWNQVNCHINRVGILEQPGFIVSCPRSEVGSLWKFLVDAGLSPSGDESFNVLRIESGFPVFGIDITEENLAQEASRTEQAISFTKGCYLGQETVARIDAVGHVNKQLCKIEFQGDQNEVPEAGLPILDSEGKEIGKLTSATWSYGRKVIVALGFLKSLFTKPGTEVCLSSGLNGQIF